MAKDTLLDIVQGILSDADGDEVNSISDTIESMQCARVVKTIFEDVVTGNRDLTYHEKIIRLTATSGSTPNVMERPAGLINIEWIQYDKRLAAGDAQRYAPIHYREPESFFNFVSGRKTDDSDVEAVTLTSGHVIPVKNAQAPTYYTFLQGYDSIIFDAYDSGLETNLQNSKSLAYGEVKPTLALTDTAIPDLPEHLFNTLVSSARALYFDLYKDGVTKQIDKLERRAEVRAQRVRHITKTERANHPTPNYGRK